MSTMHSIILSWMLLALGICTSAQHTIVELQPVEVVCSGSVISTITQSRTKTFGFPYSQSSATTSASSNVVGSQFSRGSLIGGFSTSRTTFQTPTASSVSFPQDNVSSTLTHALSTPGSFTSIITTDVPSVFTSTGQPTSSGGSTPVYIFTPPNRYITSFITTDIPRVSTSTGMPISPGDSTPVVIFTPPPGRFTSVITTDIPSALTSTGVPSSSGGSTPVHVFTPASYSTTTITTDVTARTILTGTAMTSGGTVPITVLDPPSTTFFSTTTVPGTESFPYTSTGKPLVPGGTVPPLNVDLASSYDIKLCVKQCFDVFELHASQQLYPLFCDVFYLTICNDVSTSTCTVPTTTQTVRASGTAGASSTVAVPACATAARFTVIGGAGGASASSAAGYGRLISGVVPVTPGQIIRAIAGGSGSIGTQGLSAYGNGGRGGANSGGGGAASALYIASDLIIVAGGGGGQGGAISSSGQNAAGDYRYPGDANNGTAGTVGKTRTQTNANGGVLSTAGGGQPGTNSAAGAGGSTSGYSDAAVSGKSGNGHVGGDYAVTSNTDLTYTSGAGGGGYFGGGSGASSYWLASGVRSAISGGGGGGSSFVSGNVTNSTQYPSGLNVGQVVMSFI
ncbi:hypothetical protein JADG_008268 [Aureobasidium aubasidani]|nr:hypothetical protein JADG_008268 [Aureobasidium pullulans]